MDPLYLLVILVPLLLGFLAYSVHKVQTLRYHGKSLRKRPWYRFVARFIKDLPN